jgi:hypothetical protein
MTFDATYGKTFACSRGRKGRRDEIMCILSHNNKVLYFICGWLICEVKRYWFSVSCTKILDNYNNHAQNVE